MKSSNFFMLLFVMPLLFASCDNQPEYSEDEDNIEQEYQNGSGDNNQMNGENENGNNNDNGQSASAQADNPDFAAEAASSGMMEVRLSEMAMEKANNQQVKDLAQMIRNDHQQANQQLQQIASTNNWSLPQNMMEEHQNKVNRLAEAQGADFDREYLKLMVDSHQKAVSKFEQRAGQSNNTQNQNNNNSAANSGLNSWVEKTLPVLRKHLERSKQLQGQI